MKNTYLIMILRNDKTGRFHPIFYTESHFHEAEIIKFRSRGHHTDGFADRLEAISNIESSIEPALKEHGFNVLKDFNYDLEWDGEEMPIDHQFRHRSIL